MTVDRPPPGGPLTQQELVGQIVEHVRAKAFAGGERLEWTLIRLTWSMVGREGIELEIGLETVDGPFAGWLDEPIGCPPALQQLRDLMYVRGEGSWFTLNLLIHSDGQFSAQFGYEAPDPGIYLDSDLEEDLRMYPRARVPKWMCSPERTALQADYAESEEPSEYSSGVRGVEHRHMDRSAAIATAAHFIPPEPDMRYLKVTVLGTSGDEPSEIWSELLGDRSEYRKVQKFHDGRVGLAGGLIDTDRTWLEDDPIPDLDELAADPGLHAIEISPSEFETEWLAAGGWQAE